MKEKNSKDIINIKTYSQQKGKELICQIQNIKGKSDDFNYEEELIISNIKEKDDLTLVVFHKIIQLDKTKIKYKKLIIRIIKELQHDKSIDIEITNDTELNINDFLILNFLYYDIFKVNEQVYFFFIFLFNNFYIYKIYEKEDNKLYYEILNIKNNSNYKIEESNTHLLLGNSIYNDNILEYAFLEKPKNNFLYLIFNLNSISIENNFVECKINIRNLDKNILDKFKLKKFWRGFNNDKFIFIEGKKFYMIAKDQDDSRMQIYPFEINYENTKILPNKVTFLVKILDKTYIIVDMSKLGNFNKNNQAILFIFEIYYDVEKNIINTKIIQEIYININSKDGNFYSNLISTNKLMIIDDQMIYYIILNNNCLVDYVYLINKKDPKILPRKYNLNSDNEFIRLYIMNSKKCCFSCTQINIKERENNYNNNKKKKIIDINLNNYNSYINSSIKNHMNKLIRENRVDFDKNYNSIKINSNAQNEEIDKSGNAIEKLSKIAVEIIEDIPQEKDASQYNNINNENKKLIYNSNISNNYINNSVNENKWPTNILNYINNTNQMYKNNNSMAQLNLTQNNNQMNNGTYIQRLNQYNQMNEMNKMHIIDNSNLIQNSMNNNYIPNNQLYSNINPNFFNQK
jgi:hypothetical protein